MKNGNIGDRAVLDTKDMLESGFLDALRKTKDEAVSQIETISKMTPNVQNVTVSSNQTQDIGINRETLIIELHNTRDGLCDCFSSVNYNSGVGRSLITHINTIGNCIEHLGGEVVKFNPFDHLSGLKEPNLIKNAHSVLEFTKQCYNIGSVEGCNVEKDGRTININFAGQEGDTLYKAEGRIFPKQEYAWAGNEAIDYIYTPSEGKMSVKALDNTGKWIDKSASFVICWDLHENPIIKKEESIKDIVIETQNKPLLQVDHTDDVGDTFAIIEEV